MSEVWGNTYEPPTEQVYPRLLRKWVENADDFFQVEPSEASHPVLEEHLQSVAEESVGNMKDRVMLTGGCAVGALLDPERRRLVREIAELLRFE